jgi:integrase
MTGSKKPRRLRYHAGEKGKNRVRLFAHRSGNMMLEYRDENGAKKRISLQHDDFERGKAAADALAAELRKAKPARSDELTLTALFDNYEREVTPTKGDSAQTHDKRARKLFERCWGKDAIVRLLDRCDWDKFIQQRRSGELRPEGGKRKRSKNAKARPVRNRVIEQNLRFLLAVCNWAETVRVKGRPMLERNPFRKFPVPVEKNPDRPLTTDDEFARLANAAKALGPQVELYLLLTHETGHRCTAVGRLRWSDVDLETGWVTWRAAEGNKGYEHSIPLSDAAAEALRAAHKAAARIGDGWVFPSPTEPEKPIRRDLLRDWWQKLEAKAGLERIRGRGWHSLRRKFATDLKHTPMPDLQSLGGWRDHNTILKCYQRPDETTMRSALEKRAERRAATA